ncbi:hypothetical protein GLYMA_04G117100v4 [Glycine max]|uniref:Uncharacterized protein n=1 Tax=Glycine max TaxID=3847 RepID=K7KJJ0_SOYBN|nr:hypothetical protein JHK86_009757 [Glycine max]KAH1110950.1 hypothetical protein GYH30_009654 [Glycine max]KRH62575.1 hypothetical protein GLYMA_04G117100v4 [Glycine max]
MNCNHPVTDNGKHVDATPCVVDGYSYAIAGDLKAKDFQVGCHVKMVATTSWWGLNTIKLSYSLIHRALVYMDLRFRWCISSGRIIVGERTVFSTLPYRHCNASETATTAILWQSAALSVAIKPILDKMTISDSFTVGSS